MVPLPFLRIFCNVSARISEFLAISQHALEVIPLPDGSLPLRLFMRAPSDDGFEGAHNGPDRAGGDGRLAQIARRKGAAVLRPYKRFGGSCADRESARFREDSNDPVKMIRHDHKFVEFDVSKVQRNSNPTFPNEPAQGVRNKIRPCDVPENAVSLSRTYRNEVCIWSTVVPPFEPNGLPVHSLRVLDHQLTPRGVSHVWQTKGL